MLRFSEQTNRFSWQSLKRQSRLTQRFARVVFGYPSIIRTVIPDLLRSHDQRVLFREMGDFTDELPSRLTAPIQETMAEFSSASRLESPDPQTEKTIRNLADLAVLIHRQETIGYCLQRSLTRYYFLRRAGLPVRVHFGARPAEEDNIRLIGHAWLTHDGDPYYEESENWQGYTVILSYPQEEQTL